METILGIGLLLLVTVFILGFLLFNANKKISALFNELSELRKSKALDELEIKKLKMKIEQLTEELDSYKTHANLSKG